MTTFIDAQRDPFGIEPICRVLQFAPATYYAATSRPASARAIRDETLKLDVARVWEQHRRVYGADKVLLDSTRNLSEPVPVRAGGSSSPSPAASPGDRATTSGVL